MRSNAVCPELTMRRAWREMKRESGVAAAAPASPPS
jgi:hypothetical protein